MSDNSGFRDFDLTISSESGEYFAKVNDSPAGQSTKVKLRRPFPDMTRRELMLSLENAVLKGQSAHRGGPMSKEEKVLRDFGAEMFNIVFKEASEIANQFSGSLHLVQQSPGVEGLRVKLRVEPPDLAALPWEYVYDAAEDEYLCLRNKTPLVRFLELPKSPPTLAVNGPLNVLGMIANPGGKWPALDAENERRRIDDAIKALDEQHVEINFRWVHGGTAEHLLDIVQTTQWHVFHFIGHGGVNHFVDHSGNQQSEGFIVLEDGLGGANEIPAHQLRRILQNSTLRLAVLNCCDSARGEGLDTFASVGASLVRSGIPAVVAMQFPITDDAAIQFSRQFYKSMSKGDPVETAMTRARINMNLRSSVEWGIPVLFTRAPNGVLFAIDRDRVTREQPAKPRAESSKEQLRRMFERA